MSNTATVTAAATAPVKAPMSDLELEAKIDAILEDRKAKLRAKREAEAMAEPDWENLTESDIANSARYIPTIDHDVPDYMNVQLKDQSYVPVWVNKDMRRSGSLLAEGYEYLKPEHIAPNFKLPLRFSSDGLYEYADVICMRVHKRILYGKRRKALEISQTQLKNVNKPPKSRFTPDGDFALAPGLSLYDAEV